MIGDVVDMLKISVVCLTAFCAFPSFYAILGWMVGWLASHLYQTFTDVLCAEHRIW